MKSLLLASMIATVAVMNVSAADKSIEEGKQAFDVFHEVMHPAWHEAYPAKDYSALMRAGKAFAETYSPIANLKPVIANPMRMATFTASREELGILVTSYLDASRRNDSAMVYRILPQMHEAFEQAMSSLDPMESKLVDGLDITADVILKNHLPSQNWTGLRNSTETLLIKLNGITDSTFPRELGWAKAVVMPKLQQLRSLAADMKTSADTKDLASIQKQTDEFKRVIMSIRENYL